MKILILGGTKFLGKSIAKKLINKGSHEINFLNRGLSDSSIFQNYKTILIDRNIKNKATQKIFYDLVIDVSCYNVNQITNILDVIDFDKYIFISSSAVNAIPFNNVSPEDYAMAAYAQNKKKL